MDIGDFPLSYLEQAGTSLNFHDFYLSRDFLAYREGQILRIISYF